jgi:hypothetical protein
MEHLLEYVRHAEGVWLVWLAGLSVLALLTRFALANLDGAGWRRLLVEEDGAAYTLSFVMTFPFYLLFICLVVETTLFLIVKIGTVHAAYAAARSHIVWSTFDSNTAKKKRDQAAINVMAAFASSSKKHAQAAGIVVPVSENGLHFYAAYRAYDPQTNHVGGSKYVVAKYLYAERATSVQVRERSQAWNADVKAIVRYEMPFHLWFIGRIFGQRANWPGAKIYTITIESQVILPNDKPRSDNQKLGIGYVPPQ